MTTDTPPCPHPAGCLRDGACGWCAEVARLRAFGDEWYAAAQDYERRLGCARSPWASDEPTPLEAARDALRTRVDELEAVLVDATEADRARVLNPGALDAIAWGEP